MSDYSDLSAKAAQGRLERISGTQMGAAQAKTAIDAMIAGAAGTKTAEEAYQLVSGRPSLNRSAAAPSRMWRLRVPDSLDRRMRAYAKASNRTVSDITREAVDAYLGSQAT